MKNTEFAHVSLIADKILILLEENEITEKEFEMIISEVHSNYKLHGIIKKGTHIK